MTTHFDYKTELAEEQQQQQIEEAKKKQIKRENNNKRQMQETNVHAGVWTISNKWLLSWMLHESQSLESYVCWRGKSKTKVS